MKFNYLTIKSKLVLFGATCILAASCSSDPAKEGGDKLYMQGAMMPIDGNENEDPNEPEHPEMPDDLLLKKG